MSLIKSISGIRGTIGGAPGEGLTPIDTVTFVSAYAAWLATRSAPKNGDTYRVVLGRDARISGTVVQSLVCSTLVSMGVDVVLAGLATTPTVEMAVGFARADGGIILTASHNPANWNALKLLNAQGEFLSESDGVKLLELAERGEFTYADTYHLGTVVEIDYLDEHIAAILNLPEVLTDSIRKRRFRVVVDGINSVGAVAVPALLNALGVEDVILLNGAPDGHFAHNPEPLPEHLEEICLAVQKEQADFGVVVDPDVDRLALVCEDGSLFGEEYTLVAVSDYILTGRTGNTVSNLSSSRALRDMTEKHGGKHFASAVGEVHVVEKMKQEGAVIGGEGNGGVIFPALHYGRDALAGIALIMSHLVQCGKTLKELRMSYPSYSMSKNKITLPDHLEPDAVLRQLAASSLPGEVTTTDGLKIDFSDSWVHMRRSNTEPIIRIYSEAPDEEKARELADRFMNQIRQLL